MPSGIEIKYSNEILLLFHKTCLLSEQSVIGTSSLLLLLSRRI